MEALIAQDALMQCPDHDEEFHAITDASCWAN
jgi:hypothetical protein